ncbi:Unannotated [Lentimonas sp. CC19]|nr:Unannotated [Lentimonas sp. CC10]CAA6697579.1 Unannotated [Lentimonas sp. CC19]CAA7072434.1 Unannotated [Lentimonas sp. CC11]
MIATMLVGNMLPKWIRPHSCLAVRESRFSISCCCLNVLLWFFSLAWSYPRINKISDSQMEGVASVEALLLGSFIIG